MYCILSTYILYRSICPLVTQTCTVQNEVVSRLTPRKYIVLNGNFVFDLHNFDLRYVFQEHNPAIKRQLPVLLFKIQNINKYWYSTNPLGHKASSYRFFSQFFNQQMHFLFSYFCSIHPTYVSDETRPSSRYIRAETYVG